VSLRKIPIEVIVVPEVRASSKFTPEQLEFFKSTVEAFGVVQDPVVRPLEPGKYELVAGLSRITELKNRGETEIQVKVIDADERTALFMHLSENLARGSIDPVSAATVMAKAKALGSSIDEISKIMGKSPTWVRRTLALLELPEQYKEALRTKKLTPTHVYLAARMPTSYEVDSALHTFLTHGWNTNIAETYVTNRLSQLTSTKKAAQEKGVEYTPPVAEPEKLISYKMCTLCGFRIPSDQITVQLVCDGCRQLCDYITKQLGPWEKCKDTVYNALQGYFGQQPRVRIPVEPSKEAAAQE